VENFLLLTIIGVLLLYFFSSTSVYKSLYKKVNEEKNLLEAKNKELQKLIDRYDKQIKGSVSALENAQDNLKVARDDLQQCKLENNELNHRLQTLQERADELYAQVNTMN
jgi:predicted  nucleic acid-binding Zn-ribbon protein